MLLPDRRFRSSAELGRSDRQEELVRAGRPPDHDRTMALEVRPVARLRGQRTLYLM